MKVFLSHSHRDAALVREIRRYLPTHISTWLDEHDLLIGADINSSIRHAIQDEADFVIIFLGHEALTSEWIKRELEWALEREGQIGRTFVLPVLLDDIWEHIQPADFRRRVYFNCMDQTERSLRDLAQKLSDHLFAWLSRHLDSRRAKDLEQQREDEVAKQAGDALINLTKDETYAEAEKQNLARTYRELTQGLGSLSDPFRLTHVKERLQTEICSLKTRVSSSDDNPFLNQVHRKKTIADDSDDVAKDMWGIIAAAAWEKSQQSSKRYRRLLEELASDVDSLEKGGAQASDILEHVRCFLCP